MGLGHVHCCFSREVVSNDAEQQKWKEVSGREMIGNSWRESTDERVVGAGVGWGDKEIRKNSEAIRNLIFTNFHGNWHKTIVLSLKSNTQFEVIK